MFCFCNVTIAPIRIINADSSEMISQMLFGEFAEILQKVDSWWEIKCDYDGYVGWVDEKQFTEISSIPPTNHLCFQKNGDYTYLDENHQIVLGSNLPNYDGLQFKIEKRKYSFSGKAIEANINNKDKLVKITSKYLNTPYLWGGRSPFGIDCSGFTQMVYKFLNIPLKRDAYQQVELGETINFVAETKEGDLAYFGKEERITHVGIIIGKNKIIHASGKVRIDSLDHLGIFNAETKKYSHKLKTIKRIL